jgi:WD40 repeat protein
MRDHTILSAHTSIVNHENNAPVLDTCFSPDGSTVFSAGCDKAVRMWKLGEASSQAPPQQVGAHDSPVSCVNFLPASNLIVSGGWDKLLKFWDSRTPQPVGQLRKSLISGLPGQQTASHSCFSCDASRNSGIGTLANQKCRSASTPWTFLVV